MDKKLTRSVYDRKMSGVCGGLAEFFGMDSGLIRLLYLAATIFTGCVPGLVIYIIMAAVLPEA